MSPLILYTPTDSPTDDASLEKSVSGGPALPDPRAVQPTSLHSETTLKEEDTLSIHVRSKRPVYIDTDYLSIASVVAASRYASPSCCALKRLFSEES